MKRKWLSLGMLGLLCFAAPQPVAQTQAAVARDAATNSVSPVMQAHIHKLVATLGPDPSRGTCLPQFNLPTNLAQGELIAIGKPATLSLCAVLAEKDTWRRIMAIEALSEIRDPRAFPTLINALQFDSSDTVQGEAAEGLSNLGDKEAVPFLIAALKVHSTAPNGKISAYVAGKAAQALGKIGDTRAIPPLLTLIGSRDVHLPNGGFAMTLGEEVAKALGKLGTSSAGSLMRMLSQENREVRKNAATALGIMKERRAVPQLLRLFISYFKAPYTEDSYEDSKVSSAIIEALGKIGDKQVTLPLLRMADVKTLLHADYYSVDTRRDQILQVLGKIGDRRAVPALLMLRSAKERQFRETALIALTQIRTPEVIEPLLKALEEEKDDSTYSYIYDEIIEALGLMRETRALPALLKALKADNIADDAAVAIGRIDGRMLFTLLQNNDADVRRAAIRGLGETSDEHAIPSLLPLLHEEEMGYWVVEALGKLGTPQLLPLLESLMRDPDRPHLNAPRRAIIAIKQRYKL